MVSTLRQAARTRAVDRTSHALIVPCPASDLRLALLVLAAVAALLATLLPAAAQAQDGRFSSTRTVRPAPPPATSTSAAARAAAAASQNRRLVSGLGSAANVSPGWYSRNLSQPVVEGGSIGFAPYYQPIQPLVPLHLNQVVVVQPTPLVIESPPPQVVVVERERDTRPLRPVRPDRGTDRYGTDRWSGPSSVDRSVEPVPRAPEPPPPPRHVDPQRFLLRVSPADALVYLDDERLGLGSEVAAFLAEDPLELEPGVHVLEVSHPDHKSQRLVFGITDEPVTITIDLAADRPSRRALVR